MKAGAVVEVVCGAAAGLELVCYTYADRCQDSALAVRLRKLALSLVHAQHELRQLAGGAREAA